MLFHFIDYGQSIFDHTFSKIKELNNSIIVVNSVKDLSLCRKSHFEHYGLSNNLILTMEEFKEMIFFKEKPIVKGEFRLISFFKSLNEEQKTRFNINNIFDCIEFGNRFFKLYEDLGEERKVKQNDLYEWQKETFKHLENIKDNYKNYMIARGLEDRIFVFNPGRADVSKISQDRIIFLNIFNFSRLEKHILESLKFANKKIDLFIQMPEEDFDIEKMKITNVSIPNALPNIEIKEMPDNFIQSVNLINDISKVDKASVIDLGNRVEDSYLNEISNLKLQEYDYFTNTEFYNFLNDLFTIVENVESIDNQITLKISDLLKVQGSYYFSKYYEMTPKDKRSIVFLAKSGYKYIPKGFVICNKLYEDVEKIFKIDSFDDFFRYFAKKDFSIFNVNKYSNIYEKFYDALIEMEAINKNLVDNKWKSIFSKRRLCTSLLKFLLNLLKNRKVALNLEKSNCIKSSLNDSSYNNNIFLINCDQKSMTVKGSVDFFLTDRQRKRLNLKNREVIELENRYKFIRALASSNKAFIYYIKDMEKGLETSSIVEEIKKKLNLKLIKTNLNIENYEDISKAIFKFESNHRIESNKIDSLPLIKSDFVNNNQFSIGFYDYNDLNKCKYRYYLKSLVKLGTQMTKVVYRIDPNLLGNIIHSVLNEVAFSKKEDVLQNNFMISYKEVEEILNKIIDEEKFKIATQYKRYYEKILYPFIVKGVISFYKSLKLRLKNEKIKNYLIEVSEKQPIYEDDKNTYSIKGKADLRIETSTNNYIIDYKTGHADSKQLDFYHILYYNEKDNVVKWFYKFFDENLKEETSINVFEEEIKASMNELVNLTYYPRTENKSICRYCEYLQICRVRGI